MRLLRFCCLFFFWPALAVAQFPEGEFTPFQVDSAVAAEVESRQYLEVTGTISIAIFREDTLVFSNFDSLRKAQMMVIASWMGDSLVIFGYIGIFSGPGFVLMLSDKSARIFNFIATDGPEIYRMHPEAEYRAGLFIPCATARVRLATRPRYEPGEIISGIVELTGDDFYEKDPSGGRDHRYRMTLKAWFQEEVPVKN